MIGMVRPGGAVDAAYSEYDLSGGVVTCDSVRTEGLKPDLAVFLPSLAGGGAEAIALRLCGEFADRGLLIDVIAGTSKGERRSDVPESVRFIDLGARRFRYALPALTRYLTRTRPPVMLSFLSQANLMAVTARWICSHPNRLVISERSNLSAAVATPDAPWFRILPALMRVLYRRADHIIAVSEGVAEDLVSGLNLPRERITAIPNPVATREIVRLGAEAVDHPWFVFERATPIVIGVGRLAPTKDFATLIRGVALTRPRCRLVIIGEGPERQHLANLAKEQAVQLSMPGFVRNPYPWMAKADVVALSSRAEGFPNVLVEALALGKPIVATDCPSGPAEILAGGRYGSLVPVGDPEAFAEALSNALIDSPSPSGQRRLTEEWSVTSIADRYLDVLFPGD